MPEKSVYVAGGTVQAGGGVYLERAADRELLELCRAGIFAFILTSRQMGKSSLMVRTVERLYEEDVRSVIVDLTALGADVTQDQWYKGFLLTVEDQLGLSTNATRWWQEHEELGVPQRFNLFLSKVVLQEVSQDIVIFVDEIDTTLRLGFTDDFFTAIRYLYNARADTPDLTRLSFVLIGVATPGDLIKDQERTPFNIGQRVELTDFTFDEARPLVAGLSLPAEQEGPVLGSVLSWTGGHPYLTLRVFRSLAEKPLDEWSDEAISRRVSDLFFGAMSEQDSNLQFVRDMLTKKAPDSAAVLETYRDIRRGKKVRNEEQSLFKSWLKLSGVVCARNGFLEVRNRIYQTVFTTEWVRDHLGVNWGRVLARIGLAILLLLILGAWPLAWYAWDQKEEAEESGAEARRNLTAAETERARAEEFGKEARKQASIARAQEKEARLQQKRAEEEAAKARTAELKAWQQQGIVQSQRRLAEKEALRARAAEAEARRQQNIAELKQREADEQRKRAEGLKEISLARSLASQSAFLQETRPDLSGLLAAESLRRYPTPEAGQTLRSLFGRLPYSVTRRKHGDVTDLSRDGKFIAVQNGAAIEVFLTDTGQSMGQAPLGDFTAQLSNKGTLIAIRSSNSTIIWDIQSGAELSQLTSSTPAMQLIFSPDDKWIAGVDAESTIIWETATGKEFRKAARSPRLRILSFDRLGRMLALGAANTVQLWSLESDAELILPHEKDVVALDFSRDGKLLATAEQNGKIIFWDPQKGKELWRLSAGGTISSLVISRDKHRITTASKSGAIRVLDAKSGSSIAEFSSKGSDFMLAHNEDGSRLIVVSGERFVQVWRTSDWKELAKIGFSQDIGFDTDGSRIVTVSPEGIIDTWDIHPQWGEIRLSDSTDMPSTVLLSPDGSRVVTGGFDGTVRAWDLDSGKKLLDGRHQDWIRSAAFRSDSQWLITGSDDDTAQIWDVNTGQILRSLTLESSVNSVAFHPDGTKVATSTDDAVVLWDATTGKEIRQLTMNESAREQSLLSNFTVVAFSPDGKKIVSGTGHGQILVWDVVSGEQLAVMHHGEWINALAFNLDGSQLISGGDDNAARIWDFPTGQELIAPLQHEGFVYTVAFSPNGQWILTEGGNAVRIWDRQGNELARFTQEGPLTPVAFSSDSSRLIVLQEDRLEVQPWRAEDLSTEVCQRLRRSLTAAEWSRYIGDDESYEETCKGFPGELPVTEAQPPTR